MLRPLLYSLNTTPLRVILLKYCRLHCHFYVDNAQIYLSFSPELDSSIVSSIESCMKDVFSWIIGNKLSVNPNKSEYPLFNSKSYTPVIINLNFNTIASSESAKNFGVIF